MIFGIVFGVVAVFCTVRQPLEINFREFLSIIIWALIVATIVDAVI